MRELLENMKNYVELSKSVGKKLVGKVYGFSGIMLVFEDGFTIFRPYLGYDNDVSIEETDMELFEIVSNFDGRQLIELDVMSQQEQNEARDAQRVQQQRDRENYERRQYAELKAKYESAP